MSETHNNPFGWKRPFACRPQGFLTLTYRPLLLPCKGVSVGVWKQERGRLCATFATCVYPTYQIKAWRDYADTWAWNLPSVPTSKAGCDLAYVLIFTPKSTTTHARTCKTSQVAAARKLACIYMRMPWKSPPTCRCIAHSTVQLSSISDFPAF